MEGQGIEHHIFYKLLYMPSNDNKLNDFYISWKKDDSLIKSWIRRKLVEEVPHTNRGFIHLQTNVEGS